ncbi:hypothetical protein FOZ63_030029 [Perkinsus olseni]|uniref:Uncharacterized protein n=1 Tax=Perkinsus olseni TaxID=32597 RepID=A0A7J6P7F1_PEROL|nr:hypothetical protein FOZ63_030029 [Perkinsus olseni]
MPIIDIPAPPELTIPPEVLANVENIANVIRLPEPAAFTATPGTYREFPGPFDVRAVHQTPQVGEREARTLSDLGMQDLVDRANALNKHLFEHPTMGLPSQLYQDAYNDIVRRMDAFRGYDVSPQIGAAIMENIVHPPELTPVAPSAINGMLAPVFEAIRATCGDCCRRSVPQRSSSSSSFLDVEDRSPLRRVLVDTYAAYADAWIGMSSALHEIMA